MIAWTCNSKQPKAEKRSSGVRELRRRSRAREGGFMSIHTDTQCYERWLGKQRTVDKAALKQKHKRMR